MALKKKAAPAKKAAQKKKATPAKKAAPKKKAAVKKAAVPKAAPPKNPAPKRVIAGGSTRGNIPPVQEGIAVTVHVRFDHVNSGDSDCTVTHNNEDPQNLTESGSVSIDGVKRGDTIEISSDSPGDTTVTVSGANTNPVTMTAVPGQHLADFFVVI